MFKIKNKIHEFNIKLLRILVMSWYLIKWKHQNIKKISKNISIFRLVCQCDIMFKNFKLIKWYKNYIKIVIIR